ncbi:hypothetical protein PHLCEN_2v8424 [Hermanssonia centrifuga]|uniref:Uncharacterized protein n=1 Tax=Hermanssonia centrifuga TaxID=98765 RepID=A0A2R6NTR8_9APHY|nr:hypothetical protein PHLCEN_2v8424 [Hermanssonia centrifuga]
MGAHRANRISRSQSEGSLSSSSSRLSTRKSNDSLAELKSQNAGRDTLAEFTERVLNFCDIRGEDSAQYLELTPCGENLWVSSRFHQKAYLGQTMLQVRQDGVPTHYPEYRPQEDLSAKTYCHRAEHHFSTINHPEHSATCSIRTEIRDSKGSPLYGLR